MRVHKNRIIPMILLYLLITVVLLGIFTVFLVKAEINSYVEGCNEFDGTVSQVAQIATDEIDRKLVAIDTYSDVVGYDNDFTRSKLNNIFVQVYKCGNYNNVGLMFRDTEELIYDTSKTDSVELSSACADELHKYLETLTDTTILYSVEGMEHSIIYVAPVYVDGSRIGLLFGVTNGDADKIYEPITQSDDIAIVESDDTASNAISNVVYYVFDDDSNIVAYDGWDNKDFDYKRIPESSFFDSTDSMEEATEKLMNNISDPEFYIQEVDSKRQGKIDDLDKSDDIDEEDIDVVFRNESMYMWYEKDINLESGDHYVLVVGKIISFSEKQFSQMEFVFGICGVMSVVFFGMMIMSLIGQSMSNRKLSKMAYYDMVTGWYNWNRFVVASKKIIRKRKMQNYAFVTFDICKFRAINDIDGHITANRILMDISLVLQKKLKKNEAFTRFSADEFDALISYINEEELDQKIRGIDEAIKQRINYCSDIRFYYGVYIITDYKLSIPTMNNYASLARGQAKTECGDIIGYFDNAMRENMLREKKLEDHMEQALEDHEFKVYLQPKYSVDGNTVAGAEALVRWISPTLGFVSPGDFIPLFEKNRFVKKLDIYMLDSVCKMQKEWIDAGRKIVPISVNISRVHISESCLVDDILRIVDSYELPHSIIELELTESAFFDNKAVLLDTIARLRTLGFPVSMDDFGSGFSSLNSLKDLDLDIIKLDGEFFKYKENAHRGKTIVRDTIQMAKDLDIKIVAEGIETKDQVEMLDKMGCDLIQGYYFAKPMPVDEYEKLMDGTLPMR